tara:strand:- start:4851 stop:5180 length:330 start_codon:yes stop_codon:yes gene_type:complete
MPQDSYYSRNKEVRITLCVSSGTYRTSGKGTHNRKHSAQEIVAMQKLFALVSVVLLASCSTVDATYNGGKAVVNGVAKDTFGLTSGTFDVISNVIKDVATKTGVDIEEE